MVYMFLADGFEETEAIGCLDVLRRAGIEVKTVSIDKRIVSGSHKIEVCADILKSEVDLKYIDGVILPGGMPGTTNLQKDEDVIRTLKYCAENKKLVAAICAAPMILGELGLLQGKKAVCYPGFEEYLTGAEVQKELVAADRNFITAKGAGASMLFGAEIADWFEAGAGQDILDQMQHPKR